MEDSSKTLDEAIEKAKQEKPVRYPILDIAENIEEIREVCLNAAPYITKMNPELVKPAVWEFTGKVVLEMILETFKYLNERKSVDYAKVFINWGQLATMGISYAVTKTADKNGTFNPYIEVGHDMLYETPSSEYDDLMTSDMANTLNEEGIPHLHPMFYEQRGEIVKICQKVATTLLNHSKIDVQHAESLTFVVVAFFRKMKEWLINHKDDNGETSQSIRFGRLVIFGIDKRKDGTYFISVTPAQTLKMEYAKGDDKSEVNS